MTADEHERPDGDGSSGPPSPRRIQEERARISAAAPEDREQVAMQLRLEHARRSLDEAVSAGRIAQPEADSLLDRLARGEDAHAIRRELRRAGVLLGRSGQAAR